MGIWSVISSKLMLILYDEQVARKRIRRKPGKLVAPSQSVQAPRPLAPSPSSANINASHNDLSLEMTDIESQINVSDREIQLKNLQSTPNRVTTTSNGSNNNRNNDHKNNANQTLVKTPHKKTCKESLESKRERKAAKTLAIITGMVC